MSARAIRVAAFAKVNLVLDLVGARSDGYTEIATVFQTIDLADVIELSAREGGELRVEIVCEGRAVDCAPQENLAVRAARAWALGAGWSGALQIRLDKRIPSQAGLGGGSADAAAVLWGLEHALGPRLGDRRLTSVARGLGADVPYFLTGGTALGTGRGDRIEPLTELLGRPLVLARHGRGLVTGEVFERARGQLTHAGKAPNIQRFLRYLRAGQTTFPPLGNDLEPAAGALEPAIVMLCDHLRDLGGHAAMTGSGSAVFAIFGDAGGARAAADELARRVPGAWVLATRTLSRPEIAAQRTRGPGDATSE